MMNYDNNNIAILLHFGMGDNINCSGMVNYASQYHESVTLFIVPEYVENVKKLYEHNPKVIILSLCQQLFDYQQKEIDPIIAASFFNDYDNVVRLGARILQYCRSNKIKLYRCGMWKKKYNLQFLPYCFYDDLQINRNVMWIYSHIPQTENSMRLYNLIKDHKYIFCHIKNINQIPKIKEFISNIENQQKCKFFIINPIYCLYQNTEFSLIENQIINNCIFDYCEIMKKSEILILENSSFFCLSLFLNIQNKCYVLSPHINVYKKYIFNENNGFDKKYINDYTYLNLRNRFI
jgi:hypothetical protein